MVNLATLQVVLALWISGGLAAVIDLQQIHAELVARNVTERTPDGWARFCDDTRCGTNCGRWVNIYNSGCLVQRGRNSLQFQQGYTPISLVFSPAPSENCPCQTECKHFNLQGKDPLCVDLTGNAIATSFRFINQGCGANTC